jgi:sirohydrochlorin cobaltochelatase
MSKAIILLGHGSRDPLWRQPMEAVAARVARQAPAVPVRCAYMEMEQPDLAATAAALVAGGATDITVVPMFLGAGKHVRNDLPNVVEAARTAHPAVRFHLQKTVGEDPRLLGLLASIALE